MKYLIYNNSPIWVQNFLCTIKGFQERRLRFGKVFDQKLESLLQSEWYSEQEITEYKNKEISELVHLAYNIEYYHELFKSNKLSPSDILCEEDLYKIPILTKEDVRSNYKKLLNINYHKQIKIQHTSGSTGKSLTFNMSEDAINFRWAIWFRHRSRFGIKLNDKYATFTGLPVVPLTQSKPPYYRVNIPMNQTIFTMHHMSKDKVPSIVEKLNGEDFIYYSGYPSIIYNLAILIEELNLQITNPPQVIFTGAENLYENQRIKIAQIFKCIVTDQYGFSEGAGNASRCEHDLFHEDFEFGVLQCDQTNHNFESSFSGEIIATGFANLAMPFIRYKVGDTATWTNNNDCKLWEGI
jgi:phenylacetate-CoA ligase